MTIAGIKPEHQPIFYCANEINPMAHVDMLAAVQPFLSGAASKTINMPRTATVKDVSNVYRHAWKVGVKAISLYRDGSKLTQPLSSAEIKTEVEHELKEELIDTSDIPEAVKMVQESQTTSRLGLA
jgi:ribonucleoside-diphosphate reductase alpha chain